MIIGIDLGGTNIRAGLIENGIILKKTSASYLSDQTEGETLDLVKHVIKELITPQTTGIGVGVPSVVDIQRGIVYNAANIPAWKEVHLKTILEEEFQLPVAVNNDSNCFTLGEKHFGAGKKFQDVVGITLGTGVGAGITIGGKLYPGSNAGSGEIGSLQYLAYDFEHYCSSRYFSIYHHTTGKEAFEKASAGDPAALAIWDTFGIHIGNLVQAALYAYDPEIIIFGGSISNAFPFFSKQMLETLKNFPYPETVKKLSVEVSKNNDISLLGASVLITSM